MASTQSGSSAIASLDDYTFDLRHGLRVAARAGLSELENMIMEAGYGWLDGYIESIMESSSRATITDLMKTPSRTHTVKKTRANNAAAKEKTEKIRGLNASIHPAATKQSPMTRQPFSPLQPRSLNTVSSVPVRMLSPSPAKAGKGSPLVRRKIPANTENKPKPKAKKGKSKKVVVTEQPSVNVVEHDMPVDMKLSSQASKSSRSKSKLAEKIIEDQVMTEETNVEDELDTTIVASEPSPPSRTTVEASRHAVKSGSALVPDDPVAKDQDEVDVITPAIESQTLIDTEAPSKPSRNTEFLPNESSIPPNPDPIDIAPTPEPPTPAPAPTTAVPMRQVRSSWLSKALGIPTVPNTMSNGNGGNESSAMAMRKSVAASIRSNPSSDLTTIRKSLAPVGGFATGAKRPSESAEDTEEEMRPEKVFKFDRVNQGSAGVADPISQPQPPATVSKSAPEPSMATQTPAPTRIPIDVSHSQSQHGKSDRHRSDIHKVTKALDELRERTAAKEAAKQKAALAASTGPRHTSVTQDSKATTTTTSSASSGNGPGLLRGLGSLGVFGRSLGLGGTAKSAEEEALRLQTELEDERKAEMEAQAALDKLIGEMSKPEPTPSPTVPDAQSRDERDTVAMEQIGHTENVSSAQFVRSRTPEVEEVDMVDESRDSVQTDEFVTAMVHRDRTPSPLPEDQIPETTTPVGTPPRTLPLFIVKHNRAQNRDKEDSNKPRTVSDTETRVVSAGQPAQSAQAVHTPQAGQSVQPPRAEHKQQVEKSARLARQVPPTPEEEEEVELPELPEPVEEDEDGTDTEEEGYEADIKEMPAKKMFKSDTQGKPSAPSKVSSSASTISLAPSSHLGGSTSSQATNATSFSHASTIAGKTLGFKPTTGPVKSLQLAAAAAKKDQEAKERKAQLKEQAEQRKAQAAKRKAEEERVKLEEERKARAAELEEKRRLRLEAERRRKEREERIAAIAREKAAREEKEAAAAKAKQMEEEAARKRKFAATLGKSGPVPAKRIAAPAAVGPQAQGANGGNPIFKAKEALKPIKPTVALVPSSSTTNNAKLGPTVFRTAETTTMTRTSATSTVTLVQPRSTSSASNVLQQGRIALQAQLEEKVLEVQSEDIVLPDIASEYSDSDDSDKEDEWKRPEWAESPELRAALQQQACRNPDELFGPIKPISMEELFKVRTGKFRARTSSANWNTGDRLTRSEEIEYARRMGFKSTGQGM